MKDERALLVACIRQRTQRVPESIRKASGIQVAAWKVHVDAALSLCNKPRAKIESLRDALNRLPVE